MEALGCIAVAVTLALVVRHFLASRPSAAVSGARLIVANYRGRCTTCGHAVAPGQPIFWHPETRQVRHSDCAGSQRATQQALVAAALARIEKATGPVSRKNALQEALTSLPPGEARATLLLEASRIEVTAVLDKVDSLKSARAKRRHLEQALKTLREDEVPDELQREQLAWLTDALAALEVS